MRYFDANCHIGRFNHWHGHAPVIAEDLLQEMDHCGIHQALVVASMAREYHPLDGNEQVLRLTDGHPRLQPAWVGMPPGSEEGPAPAELVAQMEELGVRALFLYPKQYHFALDKWSIDDLLLPLAERGIPVFICPNMLIGGGELSDQSDWPNVVRICQTFPDLPVVVTEARILTNPRVMYRALEACPNLHVDLSGLWIHRMVEFVCRHWGAERLLFGSGLPTRAPGAVLMQLNYSEIGQDELAAIAGGNLRRLLSWNRRNPLPEPAGRFPEPIDELHGIARSRGSLLGQGFRCGHGHLGPHAFTHVIDGAIEQLIGEMDRLGVAQGIVFADAGMNSDEIYGNDLVAEAMQRYPDRLIGLVTVNLHRSVDEIQREIARGFARGMTGIKVHPYLSGYDTDGPNIEVVCAAANERRAFVLNHNWGGTERILYLCRKYPDACFMTGHTSPEAFPALGEVDNLYVGSCPLLGYNQTEDLVAKLGADRILFGSDISWAPVAWGLGPVVYARISLEDKRLILGDNLQRLLRQYRAQGQPERRD